MDQPTSIEDLNRRFGIPGIAQIVSGNGNLAKVRVTTSATATEIYLHGAQITSWQPAGSEEVLFLSESSRWEDRHAIRGGIPICFPWFRGKKDDPHAPAHGFCPHEDVATRSTHRKRRRLRQVELLDRQ